MLLGFTVKGKDLEVDVEHILYLSRRNLETLLSKLDRAEKGETTFCSIIKYNDPSMTHRQTMDSCMIIAVPNDEYYEQRKAGRMIGADEERISKPAAGVMED